MISARPFAIACAAFAAVSLAGCSGNSAAESSGDSAQAMSRSTPARSGAPMKRHKQDATKLSGEGFYAHILLRVARNAERHGDHATASTFYRRARAFAPYDKDILMGLAQSLEKSGEALEASEVYGAVLSEEEGHDSATAGLARTLEQLAGRTGDGSTPTAQKMEGGQMEGGQRDMAVQSEPVEQMAEKTMDGGDALPPAPEGATRSLAALAPEKPAGEMKSGDDAANAGAGKPKSKFRDVLEAVEWKEDSAGSAQSASVKEPAGVDVAAATPATAVPGAMPSPTPAPAPMMSAPTIKPGGYRLQLAAYGDKARAEKARSRLEARVKDLLGEISVTVEESGKMYRVRTSSLGSRSQASGMCARLKSRSIGCFLVSPAKGARKAASKRPAKAAPKKMAAASKPTPAPKKAAKVQPPAPEASLPPIPAPPQTKAVSKKPTADTSKDAVLGWSDVMGKEKK